MPCVVAKITEISDSKHLMWVWRQENMQTLLVSRAGIPMMDMCFTGSAFDGSLSVLKGPRAKSFIASPSHYWEVMKPFIDGNY